MRNKRFRRKGRRQRRGPRRTFGVCNIGKNRQSLQKYLGRPVPCEQGAADLSAPCGASTAAPSLCRSALWCVRLLQLLAFCKTVNGCYAISFSEGFWQFLIVCCGCSPCSDLQKYVMKQRKKSSTICPKPMKDVAKIHERCHGAVASQLSCSSRLREI